MAVSKSLPRRQCTREVDRGRLGFAIYVSLMVSSGCIILTVAVALAVAPDATLSFFADDDIDLPKLDELSGGTLTLLINTCFTFMILVGVFQFLCVFAGWRRKYWNKKQAMIRSERLYMKGIYYNCPRGFSVYCQEQRLNGVKADKADIIEVLKNSWKLLSVIEKQVYCDRAKQFRSSRYKNLPEAERKKQVQHHLELICNNVLDLEELNISNVYVFLRPPSLGSDAFVYCSLYTPTADQRKNNEIYY